MDASIDERLVRDAGGDRIVGLADHRPATTDPEVQAGTRVDAPPARLDVRRVNRPLGVVLTLAGELDLGTVAVLQERLDQAICAKAALVSALSRRIPRAGANRQAAAELDRGVGGVTKS